VAYGRLSIGQNERYIGATTARTASVMEVETRQRTHPAATQSMQRRLRWDSEQRQLRQEKEKALT